MRMNNLNKFCNYSDFTENEFHYIQRRIFLKVLRKQAIALMIAALICFIAQFPGSAAGKAEAAAFSSFLESLKKSDTLWNYLEASDTEISDCLANFWFGFDKRTGAKCAFFCDDNALHGGYYWWILTSERYQAKFAIGTITHPQPDIDILVDENGDETPLTIIARKNGSFDFNFGSGELIKGSLRLNPDTKNKKEVLDLILNTKHTLEKMTH